jgi:hypothetical protein
MDPYLESHWGDVHHSLITYARDQLQTVLPPDLRARVEERVCVESTEGVARSLYPDLRIVERERGKRPFGLLSSGPAVAEPLLIPLDEPATEGFIEIREAGSGNRVITVVEVLSLSNKLPGEGQDKYLQKRREFKAAGVSLVEIDLLRTGKRLLPVPQSRLPASHRTTYQAWVSRGWQPLLVAVYRMPLRARLPVLSIPLRETDADVPLDLQALLEQCYRNGGYEDDLDYTLPPEPPLDPDDARWAAALLRRQGRRPRPRPTRGPKPPRRKTT